MARIDRITAVERMLFKGDDHVFRLNVIDKNQNPVNILGASLTFTMKESGEDEEALIVKSSAIPGEIDFVDAPNGVADITIQSADTLSLTPGVYVYDVQLIDVLGKIATLIKEQIVIEQDVTNG